MRAVACCLSASLLLAAPALAQEEDVAKELRALREKVERLEKRVAELEEKLAEAEAADLPGAGGFVHREGNAAAVRKVTLPENPTKEQVREYVRRLLAAVGDRNTFCPTDPVVRKLVQIGPDHVDVLIDSLTEGGHWAGGGSSYVLWALETLVRGRHRDLVLGRLAACPDLVKIVREKGWTKDAKPTLLAVLKTWPDYVPTEWIEAVAGFEDPATYPLLREYLKRGSNPRWTWEAIRDLPDIGIEEAVAEGWKYRRSRRDAWGTGNFASIAVYYGDIDALHWLIAALVDQEAGVLDDPCLDDLHRYVFRHVDFVGPPKEVERWFDENRDRLVFDQETRRFRVKE